MSFLEIKILPLLIFVVGNLLILFRLRDVVNLILGKIFCGLTLILFFSINFSNYLTFKEITIATILYFLVAIIAITKCEDSAKNHTILQRNNRKIYARRILAGGVLVTILCILLLLIKIMPQITASLPETIASNKQFTNSYKNELAKNDNEKRQPVYATNLVNNSLLKHYSDGILAIIAISSCALVFLQNKNNS